MENVTVGVLSGGRTAVGTRVSSETGFSPDGGCCTGKAVTDSTRATGTTECLTAKAPNIFRTERGTRVHSRRTNSTEKVYSTRTTRSSTECGRTTNYRWSTWSKAVSAISDRDRDWPILTYPSYYTLTEAEDK